MRRPLGRLHLPRARPPRRVAVGALLAAVLLFPGWLWLRDSPLASVDHVHISGVSGPQAPEVRQAIIDAARRQSTLHVNAAGIAQAVSTYPIVAGLSVKAHPLHTVDVTVREHVPVAALATGDRRIAVAADGTILPGTLTHGLPLVPIGATPGGRALTERHALMMVGLLAAAPRALRDRVTRVALGPHGLVAHLADGPALYFGPGSRLTAKWIAAARVLTDYAARGATYLDLRVPERAAAGGLVPVTGTATPPPNAQPEVQPPQ